MSDTSYINQLEEDNEKLREQLESAHKQLDERDKEIKKLQYKMRFILNDPYLYSIR